MAIAVVTGSSSGIGLHTALGLARRGFSMVMVSRDPERAVAALDRVRREVPGTEVRSIVADLSVRADVDRVAQTVREGPPIEVLVNGAGALFWSYAETPDHLERTWALDFVAPYVLTRGLLEHLDGARVVNVASRFHDGALDLEDPNRGFSPLGAYARAKLALVMFTYELARRAPRIRALAVYPGDVNTNAAGNAPWLVRGLYRAIAPILFLRPEQGAEPVIRAATDLALPSGAYLDRLAVGRSVPQSYDEALAGRLWDDTARRAGLAATLER